LPGIARPFTSHKLVNNLGSYSSRGMNAEAAELLDHFRFKSKRGPSVSQGPQAPSLIEDETADTLFMLLRFARCTTRPSQAFRRKVGGQP
jgi:hypothetical protein